MSVEKILIPAVVVIGLLLLVILLPLSLHRVQFDEVAISYDTVSRELGNTLLREGLHNLGPSGSLITFKTTQRTAVLSSLTALTTDGLLVQLDVTVAYTVSIDQVRSIINDFYDQETHDNAISFLCQAVVRDVAVNFTARDMYLERDVFQTGVETAIQQAFASSNMYAKAEIVQVVDIELGSIVDAELTKTTVAQQDVQNALSERDREIQVAQLALSLQLQHAAIVILNATRDAASIDQQTTQQVLTERAKWTLRAYAFANISQGLGKGGDFFVDSYLKSLVLQSNPGKSVIGL